MVGFRVYDERSALLRTAEFFDRQPPRVKPPGYSVQPLRGNALPGISAESGLLLNRKDSERDWAHL
jgi:hypothetical protein